MAPRASGPLMRIERRRIRALEAEIHTLKSRIEFLEDELLTTRAVYIMRMNDRMRLARRIVVLFRRQGINVSRVVIMVYPDH
jgi:hypothetical protein